MNRTDRRGSRPQSLEAARPPTALERAAGVRGAELTELGGRLQDTCRKRVFSAAPTGFAERAVLGRGHLRQ